MPQPTLSSLESDRIALGGLARALKVHPAVLLWPNWGCRGGIEAGRRLAHATRRSAVTVNPSR